MTESVTVDITPPRAFDQACHMVVDYLAGALPMGAWAVTRVAGERQTVLVSDDHGFGLEPGVEGKWTMSICRTMVSGETPRVVPDTGTEPALCDVIATAAEPLRFSALRTLAGSLILIVRGLPAGTQNDSLASARRAAA